MEKTFNKLVRDRIPAICRADGWEPKTKILSAAAFKKFLKLKLVEEAKELAAANSRELKNEIVDVYELLLTTAKTFGLRWADIEQMRKEKNKKRGGFSKRIFLIETHKK